MINEKIKIVRVKVSTLKVDLIIYFVICLKLRHIVIKLIFIRFTNLSTKI